MHVPYIAKFRFTHYYSSSQLLSLQPRSMDSASKKLPPAIEDRVGAHAPEQGSMRAAGQEEDANSGTPISNEAENTTAHRTNKNGVESGQSEVIVLDKDAGEDKVEVSVPNKKVDANASGNKRSVTFDADEDEPVPKRPVSGNPYAPNYGPSYRHKVPHLRNLPEVNKCGRDEGCGSLTKKERALFTTFFEKHPRRITVELKEDCSVLKLFAWSSRAKQDIDTVGYVLRVSKAFKCEDAFLSSLLHDRKSGTPQEGMLPRMEICYSSVLVFASTFGMPIM